ncbi:hypothetical protein DY000_02008467 [Brassica cretica]|uniref:Uncharacterized protein n=1 Tax=Brassica cretica TaxID=69181 RepID=A0ABQ7C9I7_BRACR|nr:hypothetical protein DY000_02008467 [Brassica cretica]
MARSWDTPKPTAGSSSVTSGQFHPSSTTRPKQMKQELMTTLVVPPLTLCPNHLLMMHSSASQTLRA